MTLTNFPNGISVGSLTVGGVDIRPQWQIATKTITFAGGTTNGIGDFDGTGNPATVFTVTGAVMAVVWGVCSVDLAGATATVEVGVTGNTAAIIAQTTATDIDNGDVWRDATPAVGAAALNDPIFIADGKDVILTVATANVTAGVVRFYCVWYPISADGAVA